MKIDFDTPIATFPPAGKFERNTLLAEAAAQTHLVLIPSYNSGPKLIETVRDVRRYWAPVWVVIDGSTDGSASALASLAADDPDLRLFTLPNNQGKGAAILHGLRLAEQEGFTYVLTMDADGQHPASLIPSFIAASRAHPDALILGRPVFDRSAPLIRILGRKLSNWWTSVETLWIGSFDSLFGFRVYPIASLRDIMEASRWMRRFDFDAEAAVRLCWRGFRPLNLPAPVRYFTPQQGGVSHFRYLRDNILLSWMHARLVAGFARRLPSLLALRLRSSRH
jgi:glycosyltransferase involved in cell wall biosynthesis